MDLTLTVDKSPQNGTPPGTSRQFGQSGATLGRHEKNSFALKGVDGDGLSRFHCKVVFEGDGFSVIDTKSTYGLFLNGDRLPSEQPAPLKDGDRLRLGEYELLVHLENAAIPEFAAHAEPGRIPDIIPEISPFEWPEQEAPRQRIPEHIMEEEAPMRDHIAPEREFFEPPKVRDAAPVAPTASAAGAIPDDWLSGGSTAPPIAVHQRIPEFVPTPESVPIPESIPMPIAAPARTTGTGDGFAAFLAGTAIARKLPPGVDTGASLRGAGETLRVAVEGVREILASRTQIKDEFRIEKTMLGATENNPLKFSANADEALATMIAGNREGYMSAAAAMREALKDIKVHEMALVAAIQVALKRLLEQIDPEHLKSRLEKGSLLDGIVPGARKARTWDMFETMHAEIARELEEDFNGTFGKAFAEAYEQYIRRR